ncbi:2-oxo acid dehydrogenase subunit E2 [Nocardioides immobilis]|uniref:2-oxo acid dehydrogenase subunit E2 n=1 Tax=Nocardioides immobilis TaxID=2049295 RepID=UPI0015FB3D14|nr:2-oxo acid dehydrogenase subunit E2 [Nocardioides immobilis]
MIEADDPYAGVDVIDDGPLIGVRRVIADRLGEAHRNVVPVTLHRELRAPVPGPRPYDGLVFAVVRALVDQPALNAAFASGRLRTFGEVNLGVAFDGPQGLVAPVIRGVHDMTYRELVAARRELGARVQDRRLALSDLVGGTFTVSNLGTLGVQHFTPVVNPPQVAILGVGAVRRVVDRSHMPVSLTFDHRVVDGAPAARFLVRVQHHLDNLQGGTAHL